MMIKECNQMIDRNIYIWSKYPVSEKEEINVNNTIKQYKNN